MTTIALLLTTLLLGLYDAQQALSQSVPAQDSATGAITGRVVDAITKQPLADVRIRILGNTGMKASQVVTDANGVYAFSELPPGKFLFIIEGKGYYLLTPSGDVAGPTSAPSAELRAGQRLTAFNFAMKAGGTIRGMITDDAGRPLVEATVTARMTEGSGRWAGTAKTDKRGEYEINGVPTGNFFIEAMVVQRLGGSVALAWSESPRTFYPGVRNVVDATAINVGPRDVVRDVNIIVSNSAPRGVSGRLITPTGNIPDAITVVLASSPAKSQTSLVGKQLSEGRFAFIGAKPGRYLLWARGLFGDELHAAVVPVTVSESPTEIDVMLAPTGGVDGRVVTETGEPLPSDGLRVVAMLAEGDTSVQMASPDQADVLEDGTFNINGLFGDRIFRLNGMPPEWTIKKILNGRREVEAPHVTISPGVTITNIQIVIGSR